MLPSEEQVFRLANGSVPYKLCGFNRSKSSNRSSPTCFLPRDETASQAAKTL
jgi:hypothetical protein